jgi:hypothetical protein
VFDSYRFIEQCGEFLRDEYIRVTETIVVEGPVASLQFRAPPIMPQYGLPGLPFKDLARVVHMYPPPDLEAATELWGKMCRMVVRRSTVWTTLSNALIKEMKVVLKDSLIERYAHREPRTLMVQFLALLSLHYGRFILSQDRATLVLRGYRLSFENEAYEGRGFRKRLRYPNDMVIRLSATEAYLGAVAYSAPPMAVMYHKLRSVMPQWSRELKFLCCAAAHLKRYEGLQVEEALTQWFDIRETDEPAGTAHRRFDLVRDLIAHSISNEDESIVELLGPVMGERYVSDLLPGFPVRSSIYEYKAKTLAAIQLMEDEYRRKLGVKKVTADIKALLELQQLIRG